jgi:hypothetical protein
LTTTSIHPHGERSPSKIVGTVANVATGNE